MGSPVLHVTGVILASAPLGGEGGATAEWEEAGDLWVIDGRVSYAPPVSGLPVETVRGFALPGLVDAHCHVGLERTGAVDAARAEQHAIADRQAGALLLRDAGSPSDTRWVQDREDLPRLIRAGRHIARTRRYIPGYAWEVEPDQLVDRVRIEARAGDGWVKLVGDWIDRDAGDLGPCWPRDVLTQAIAAAHDEGARVTAHCFGEESLADFAAAGTDCIEHATGLTPQTTAAFAARGIAIVPTLVNIANFPKFAAAGEEKFPLYAAHIRDLHSRRFDTVLAAHEAGVPVYVGTDAGGQLPHGLVAAEIAQLHEAGLSVAAALDAGAWAARRWLGYAGLEEGAEADLNVYLDDPREDLRALARPHRSILRGRLVAS